MIKEHDQQAKTKATPRRLAYADSDKEAPVRSLARGFSDRFSLGSSGTSNTHRQTRSASKSQRTPSKNKELAHLRRSRRLKDRSITKKKARRKKSKSRGKRSRYQETSSDSEHEEDTIKGLSSLGTSGYTREQGSGGSFRGHNTNDCYQLKKQIEEVVASGKLTHLVKDIRRNNQRNGGQGRSNIKVINMIREGRSWKRPFEGERSGLTEELTFPAIPQGHLTDGPIILEGIIEGHQVRRIHVDGGSSLEIMYEHCFRNFNVGIRSRLRKYKAPLVGFSGETYDPLGIVDLWVTMGEAGNNKTASMEFAILGDEGLSSEGTKLNSILITAKVTFTKPK
ncbi:hypothetical protein Tco_0024018 [Tanacetum coccineum]